MPTRPKAIERVNQEIKRRTRVASLFPNEASLLRGQRQLKLSSNGV